MYTEETNALIEAIKDNNLEINGSFLYEMKQFRLAFEEDSLDEYVEQNQFISPELKRAVSKACRRMNRIIEERSREKSQYSHEIERPKNTKDLLDLINPYKNPQIKSFKHAIHELTKIEKFIYEEQSKRNTQVPNQKIVEVANDSSVFVSENNEIKAPEEELHVENVDLTFSEKDEEDYFCEIAESFCKNKYFSLIISEKEDKEKISFMDLINVLMNTSKNEFTYEWFHETMKREFEKMLENMDYNNRKIIKLVKKGFLFNKPSPKLKEMKQSARENENMEAETDMKSNLKFQCTFENCGKVYSRNSGLNVHIKKHHLNVKYECQFCSRFFSSYQNCKIHMSKHHHYHKSVKLSLNI